MNTKAAIVSNASISSKYSQLKILKIPIEYVFVDKQGNLRSKAKTLTTSPTSIHDIPPLILQGSKDTEWLEDSYQPVAIYNDPFRPEGGKLVLCEVPSRKRCLDIMNYYAHLEPWFGMEQEYVLFDPNTNKPWGWPLHGEPEKQGHYYCGVGAGRVFGRDIMEAHYRACLFAGITLCGCNAEVTPSQLEYQVGPCLGVTIGDELYMARYIMERITEEFGVAVSLHPKPIPGEWNPTGCHINFSTNEMRASPDGMLAIDQAVENMSSRHFEHIEVYGQDNELRLTGEYETGHISVFSCGVGNRGASIRIPRSVAVEGKGYMEDRRPAGNIDPYAAITMIMTSSFNYKSPHEQTFLFLPEQE